MEETHKYSFPIPNQKVNIYQVFAYGILLLNMLLMSLVLSNDKKFLLQSLLQFAVLLILVYFDIKNYKKGKRLLPIGILMLAYGVFWIRYGINWAFAANLFLWLLYTISRRQFIINIDTEKVVYPSFPKKNILWKELNNVILKDDILTIDCKNNKVYQHYISHATQFVDEKAFNDFCKQQLTK